MGSAMNYINITELAYAHIRQRVTFHFDGETVSGRLDGYCRNTFSYTVIVDDHFVRNVPLDTVLEVTPIPSAASLESA